MSVVLPSEGIGSVPRPLKLIEAVKGGNADQIAEAQREALEETISEMISINGQDFPITDGEQVHALVRSVSFVSFDNLRTLDKTKLRDISHCWINQLGSQWCCNSF